MSTKSSKESARRDGVALVPSEGPPPEAAEQRALPPEPTPPSRAHRWRWPIGLAVVALLAAGAVYRWRARQHESAASAAAAKSAADRPVSVVVATATTRDVPRYLEGLGSVAAFQTVNVRTQVDGRLIRVDFREGQAVHRGDLLAEVDPRPFTIQLHQGEAALARDEAQLRGAEKNLERYAAVSAERLIPEQQTDDQRALVEQLRGTTQNDRAQIESAKLMLTFARITSPIDGITGVREVDAGNIIHAADANGIVVVTQIDPIAVIFTLPQDDLPQVAAAQARAPLAVEALGRDGAQTLAKGTLGLIDNQINQATATMRLKAIFPNADHALWPNQFVRTRVLVDVRKGALVVPAVAVQRGPEGTFVYMMTEDGRAEQRAVTLASTEGDQAILSKGLAAGAKVVIEGQSQLRAGARVLVRDGAAPSGGGAGKRASAAPGAARPAQPGGGSFRGGAPPAEPRP